LKALRELIRKEKSKFREYKEQRNILSELGESNSGAKEKFFEPFQSFIFLLFLRLLEIVLHYSYQYYVG